MGNNIMFLYVLDAIDPLRYNGKKQALIVH